MRLVHYALAALAILATVANTRTTDLLHAGTGPAVALTSGFARAFTVGAGFALAGALLAVVLMSSRDSRLQAQAARSGETLVAAPAGLEPHGIGA